MTVEGSSNVTNNNTQNNSVINNGFQNLGKDDFLKLLITQLRMQDPMEPLKDKEFIAQMAQFSSLEQMQNLNQSFKELKETVTELDNSFQGSISKLQSLGFIGKEVEYMYDGESSRDVVTGVRFEDSQVVLVLGDKEIKLTDVISVNQPEKTHEEVEETG